MAVLTTSAAAATIPWHATFEEAVTTAQRGNRPILIDFWADWCSPCKMMDAEVFANGDVAKAAEPFEAVRIDYDAKPALVRRYRIEAMPTFLVTDSYGNELFRYTGVVGAVAFRELLQSLPRDVSDFNRLARLLERNRNDDATLAELGAKLRGAGLFRTSNEYYERALDHGSPKPDAMQREAFLSAIAANYLDVKDGRLAVTIFERCLKNFPSSARGPAWTLGLGRAYAIARKPDKARAALQRVVALYPESAEAQTAKVLLQSQP
jgi:thioredoxin-like negative regulator of GroEL